MPRFLNGATIMSTTTPRSLEIARATGFDGIEARAERLLAEAAEVDATAATVQPGEVWSLNGVRISLFSDGTLDRDRLEADLQPLLQVSQAIGAAYLLAVPPRIPGLGLDAALAGVREGLEIAGQRAARVGVGVAFEFLGFFDCPIATPAAAGQLVEDLDRIELVLDSCHWHASGSGSLDEFPVDRLAMVHLNDAPPKPPPEIEDGDRVLPGLGVIRLQQLVTELRGRGYRGPWSLETFNPGYWQQDALTVARQGASALDTLLGATEG